MEEISVNQQKITTDEKEIEGKKIDEKNRGKGTKYWKIPDIKQVFKLEVFLKSENSYYGLLISMLQWLKTESEKAVQPSLVKVSLKLEDLDDVKVSKEEFEGFTDNPVVKTATIENEMACLEVETNMIQFDITKYVNYRRRDTVEFLGKFGDCYDRYKDDSQKQDHKHDHKQATEECIIFTGHDKQTRQKLLDELEDLVRMWIATVRTALEVTEGLYSCYRDSSNNSPKNLKIEPWPDCSWVCLHSLLNALSKSDNLEIDLYQGCDKNGMYKIILVRKEGEFIKYWPNGNKKRRATYLNGKLDGVEFEWFENGVLSFAANNKDGVCQAYVAYNEKSEIEETYKV